MMILTGKLKQKTANLTGKMLMKSKFGGMNNIYLKKFKIKSNYMTIQMRIILFLLFWQL